VERWAYAPGGGRMVTGSTEDFAKKTQGLQVFVFDPNAPEANTAKVKKAAALHEADVFAGKLAEALNPSSGGEDGSSPSPWEQFAKGNRATQELALAAGIANLALNEDIKPREGSSPHGIVGGRNEGAEATPSQQAAASAVQLAAAAVAQAFVSALRKAAALSKTLMLPARPLAPGAGGVTAARGAGKAFSGFAYELKHIPKHIEGTAAAQRLITREGAAHVFPDMATLARVENAIFEGGQFTGVIVRGSTVTKRFGLMFETPIGYRVAADGSRIPLYYGEAKINADGLYHVMPRTGPAR
jgi:hypothetical protein